VESTPICRRNGEDLAKVESRGDLEPSEGADAALCAGSGDGPRRIPDETEGATAAPD